MRALSIGKKTFKKEISAIESGLKKLKLSNKAQWFCTTSGIPNNGKLPYELSLDLCELLIPKNDNIVISFDFLKVSFVFFIKGKIFKKGEKYYQNKIVYGLNVTPDPDYKYYNEVNKKLVEELLKDFCDEAKKHHFYINAKSCEKPRNPKYDFALDFIAYNEENIVDCIKYLFDNLDSIRSTLAKKTIEFVKIK